MPLNQVSLDLDTTGINPDNRIGPEPHTLSNRQVRSISPTLGPFFAAGFELYDGVTKLDRGIHYQFAELHQEATLLYAREIWSVILVIDSAVSSNVSIVYQALGGHYQYNDAAIANLYETVMQDNRPIDWATGIINKPYEYQPTNHRHLLDDIFGFEPVVDYLERIKRAITLGQTDVLLAVLRALAGRFGCKELSYNLPSQKFVQYDALLHMLSKRKLLSNMWIDTVCCTWYKGDSALFEIDTTDVPVGTVLHWELYTPSGHISLFSQTKGTITSTGGIVQISLYVPSENNVNNEILYLGVKQDPNAVDFKAVSYKIDVKEHKTTNSAQGFLINMAAVPNDIETTISLVANDNERRLYLSLIHI